MRLTKYWFLDASFNMMKKVGMKEMLALSEHLVMKVYKKGDEIHEPFEGSHLIYFIKKGHVKIGRKEGDNFSIKYTLGKGNIFGESTITTGEEVEPYSAVAMSDCIICFIKAEKMEQLMEQYPKLHNSILKVSGLKFKRIERRLDDILYKDAETRIKDFLLDFVQENGKHCETCILVENIFSHSDIAKLTCTSRQTVNNAISKLRKQNVLLYDRKEIGIPLSVTQDL